LRRGQLDGGRFRLLRKLQSDRLVRVRLGHESRPRRGGREFFALSAKEAYFFGVESFGVLDKNGDQVLCVSWLGANPGIDDYYLSVVDNNAAS